MLGQKMFWKKNVLAWKITESKNLRLKIILKNNLNIYLKKEKKKEKKSSETSG